MRKIVFAINISADGFCGHEDIAADDELHAYHTEVLRATDTILCGRITYQLMVPYWPEIARTQSEDPASNEFARVFDALEKVVFSASMKQSDDPHTRIARLPVADEALALKSQNGKDIGVGGLSIASQLSERGLIDEYRFVVHPVIAGKGPRLFEKVTPLSSVPLELVGSTTFRSGAIAMHYRKAER
ncbi:MAG: dihydrofolate reductase family protein [Bacteroidetes bacterium]|nr:MAG: dihydrofolate reductase family protein [Bacteroidota bacterium]